MDIKKTMDVVKDKAEDLKDKVDIKDVKEKVEDALEKTDIDDKIKAKFAKK